jgi:Cd2+/Zn2+-exporting ATPase
MVVEEYKVENLSCATCSAKIESEIATLPEVQSVNLDIYTQKLTIQYKTKLPKALERLNRIAESIEPGSRFHQSQEQLASNAERNKWLLMSFGILLFILAGFVPEFARIPLLFASYIAIGHRVAYSAIKKTISLRVLDEHFLMTIATVGALYLGQYTEAIAVMFLYEIGQYFEGLSVKKSRTSLQKILSLKPEQAHVLEAGAIVNKRLAEVNIGDFIVVKPGERIPLDGVVRKGESALDTSSLTGEPEPMYVSKGTAVFGGFVNGSGLLEVQVTKSEAQSTVSRILKLIEGAAQRKSQTEQFITRFARIYTPVVVISALALLIIPLLLGGALATWLPRALIFLIVSCPCALVISIPLTFYIGIGIAARKGIIFKGSVFLDNLRKVKHFVFDKTGTLTSGKMQVAEIVSGIDPEQLLAAALICEQSSNHPLAIAMKNYADKPFKDSNYSLYKETPGKGIHTIYKGVSYHTGSLDYLLEMGYVADEPDTDQTLIHSGKEGIYLGYITFTDEIKSGMKEALRELRSLGVSKLSLLSGDRQEKVLSVANELGLDSYAARLVPENKVSGLETMMQGSKGLTAYVGDGLNDAPVLARADIGIAMGEIGNQASIEIADIVLLNDKPEQLTAAFKLSQRTHSIAIQNISLALGIKIVVMILGAFGLSNLWEAVIADVGVTLMAIFNAMRLTKVRI